MYNIGDPDCPICHGIGYVGKDVPVHHEEFGKIWMCGCVAERHWDKALGITAQEAEKYDWRVYYQTNAVTQMRSALIGVLERGWGWVYIHGEPGNGKTIMAKAFAVYAYKIAKKEVHYRKLSDIMNTLRESYDDQFGQREYMNRLKSVTSVPVLVVDEIGRDRQTEFSKQSLSDIMDSRYESALDKKTVTVWVGNFAPEEILESYQVDRVRDGRFEVVRVAGKSVRPAMKGKKLEESVWWTDYKGDLK